MINKETMLDLIERSKNLIEFVATIPVDMLDKNQLRKLTLQRSTIIDDAEVDHVAGLKRQAEESRLDSWSKKAYEEIFYKIDAAIGAIDAMLDISRNIVTIFRLEKHAGGLPVSLAKVTFLVNIWTYSRGGWHAREENGLFVELDIDGKRTRYSMSKSGKMSWDKIIQRLIDRLETERRTIENAKARKATMESKVEATNWLLGDMVTFLDVDVGKFDWHARKHVQKHVVKTAARHGHRDVTIDAGNGPDDNNTFHDVTIEVGKISSSDLRAILELLLSKEGEEKP